MTIPVDLPKGEKEHRVIYTANHPKFDDIDNVAKGTIARTSARFGGKVRGEVERRMVETSEGKVAVYDFDIAPDAEFARPDLAGMSDEGRGELLAQHYAKLAAMPISIVEAA